MLSGFLPGAAMKHRESKSSAIALEDESQPFYKVGSSQVGTLAQGLFQACMYTRRSIRAPYKDST